MNFLLDIILVLLTISSCSSVFLYDTYEYFLLMQWLLLLFNHVFDDFLHHGISLVCLCWRWALRLLLIEVWVTISLRRCRLILTPCTLCWRFWGSTKVPTFLDLAPCYSMTIYEISIRVDISLSTRHAGLAAQTIHSLYSGTNDNVLDLFSDNICFIRWYTLK